MFMTFTSLMESGQSFSFGNGREVWVGKESAALFQNGQREVWGESSLSDWYMIYNIFTQVNLITMSEQNISASKSITYQTDHKCRVDLWFDSCTWVMEINYTPISN